MPRTQNPKENMANEEEEGPKPTTPRIETNLNDVNNTQRKVDYAQHVYHRKRQY
jgi:hypothetical protein